MTSTWTTAGRCYATFPYDLDLIAEIKEIPGRRWHPELKAWSVPEDFGHVLAQVLNAAGGTGSSHRAAAPTLEQLMVELFDQLPEHLRAPIHKALLRVAHPDIGGDHDVAVAINGAWRTRRSA